MPTLNWIGKDAVINHHLEVPFHLLKDVPDLSCGDPGSGNLIVEGDNLVALKALIPYYKGKVKCICIDPPYNTGNEGWAYNDNVNSPAMQKWLKEALDGKTVGKEGETLDRHDRWLCMMYPRIALLRDFLTEDGAIFVCLDDNEIGPLRLLMDEIFGASNFVATVLWQKVYSPKNSAKHFSVDHDYVVIYAKKADTWRPNLVARSDDQDAAYKNRDNDPRGPWKTSDLSARNPYNDGLYPVTCPSGRVIKGPPTGRYWTISKTKFETFNSENRIWWGNKGDSIPQFKRFLTDVKQGVVPQTMWFYKDVGHTQEAKQELVALMDFADSESVFITPKPTRLIERILQIATNPGDLVLDSFGGSGTTGHSVSKMNAANSNEEPRRFIMIELEAEVCKTITRERMARVATGHTNAKGETVEALGGGFRYVTLGDALFDETGQIRNTVRFAELARHVYFTETGEPLPKERVSAKTPLLGIHRGKAIYLLYNGILSDRSINGGNALCRETLQVIEEINAGHEGIAQTVVYGTSQRLSPARLKRGRIDFKQIPYNLRIS